MDLKNNAPHGIKRKRKISMNISENRNEGEEGAKTKGVW